jgi:hypothetical protein
MKKALLLTCLLFIVNIITGFGQVTSDSVKNKTIGFNSEFSYKMLDPNEDLRKVNIFITERQKGNIKSGTVLIGSSLIALGDYQVSNTDSKFGYLMRHPTGNNQIGTEVSEAVVHSFQLSVSGTVNNWLAAHAELLYNPQQSFGTGLITDLERNQIQLRKGFILVGDLDKFPVYGAIGKMDAPFGQMGTVSPFTNSTMWHAFGGLGYGAQIGFKKWNVHATVMAVQGGAQFRAMNTPVGDSTNVPSKLNNVVVDINYKVGFGSNSSFIFGGSYLHGSAYCHEFPVFHFDPCNENNPAWTAYGRLLVNDRFTIKGGFAKTVNLWPGTHNPTPPLDVYAASKVSSKDIGVKYTFKNTSRVKHSVSAEFSDFIAGPDGAPWERQNQIVLGYSALINNSSKLFLELFRTDGYVPLNWISGSAPYAPFPPGETHSVRNAFSHGVVVGGQLTF